MAWAEEQSWFGLEDLVINNNQEQERIKNNFLKKDIWTTKFDDTIVPNFIVNHRN
jgi:hypothetical protein